MKDKTRKIRLIVNLNFPKEMVAEIILAQLNSVTSGQPRFGGNLERDNCAPRYIPDNSLLLCPDENPALIKARLRIISTGQNSSDMVLDLQSCQTRPVGQVGDMVILRLLAFRILERLFKLTSL